MEPGEGAFDDPAATAEPGAVPGLAAGITGLHSSLIDSVQFGEQQLVQPLPDPSLR